MHHYADRGVTEEYCDDEFDLQAEVARIEAAAEGHDPAPPDDWEPLT